MIGQRINESVSALFSPIHINGLEIKNRIILPAMILNYPFEGYDIGQDWVRFYRRRAEGGAGLIIAGACYVDLAGKMDTYQLGADCDEWLPSLSKIAKAIKDGGAVSAIQLNHAGRYAKKTVTGLTPVAPTAIPSKYTKELPHELSEIEIESIINSFAESAYRAKLAGFEAIELLGATGYLISQFLSPLTNHRTDDYGGSVEKRRRFVERIISAIKEKVGNDYTLIFRQSSTDNITGGMGVDDQLELSMALSTWGIHMLNMTAGWHDAPVHQIGPSVEQGAYIPYAAKIKKAVNLPVACAMRITEPETARHAIDEGSLDMVAMARALIADPDWPNKAQAGEEGSIRKCICCCNCFDQAFAKKQIECSVNPALGGEVVKPAEQVKRILVIGGGPAGMEASRILARRGHKVTLLSKGRQLGGQLIIGSKPPYKSEVLNLVKFLFHELKMLNVAVVDEVDFNTVDDCFDGLILAAGAKEKTFSVEGMDIVPSFTASQVLSDLVVPESPVIIVGAGLVGCETAEYLADRVSSISIVEIQEKALPDMGVSLRWPLLHRLKKAGIEIYTGSYIEKISGLEATIRTGEEALTRKIGSLIFAVGYTSENGLISMAKESGLPYCVIGDQKAPRRIKNAVQEGYAAATVWVDTLN